MNFAYFLSVLLLILCTFIAIVVPCVILKPAPGDKLTQKTYRAAFISWMILITLIIFVALYVLGVIPPQTEVVFYRA